MISDIWLVGGVIVVALVAAGLAYLAPIVSELMEDLARRIGGE